MIRTDSTGHAVSGADAPSLEAFERASAELRCFVGDPVAAVRTALEARPDFTMAHLLHAYLHLLGTEPAAVPVARAAHDAARGLPADARERGHLEAVRLLLEGRWHAAGRVLEDVSIAWPRDALALQVGHQIDFFTGRSRMLRDRIARALPHWSPSMPGHHAVLGMHAFGLEETGDYAGAERQGRRGVALEPRDGWSWHAVAHAMEMQGRFEDGIAWMRSDTDAWSDGSFFAVHNWWHLALFHLEAGDTDQVLALFDEPIHGARSGVILDLLDATALLWRLSLRGIDVGERWQTVADLWMPLAGTAHYAFNDLHAMIALESAGRRDAADTVLASLQRAIGADGDNAMFTRDVGAPACAAIRAFQDGDAAGAVRLLRSIREIAHRFGGSHAQRDLLELTLIEAARRAGDTRLADAYAAARSAARVPGTLPMPLAARVPGTPPMPLAAGAQRGAA
jgi:hypothetical protein